MAMMLLSSTTTLRWFQCTSSYSLRAILLAWWRLRGPSAAVARKTCTTWLPSVADLSSLSALRSTVE
eukprot:2967056-Pleurochrysis_carterae.AAC.1